MQPIKPTVMNYRKPNGSRNSWAKSEHLLHDCFVVSSVNQYRHPVVEENRIQSRQSVSQDRSRDACSSRLRVSGKGSGEGTESMEHTIACEPFFFSFAWRGRRKEAFLSKHLFKRVFNKNCPFAGFLARFAAPFPLCVCAVIIRKLQKNDTAKNAETNNRITVMINLN